MKEDSLKFSEKFSEDTAKSSIRGSLLWLLAAIIVILVVGHSWSEVGLSQSELSSEDAPVSASLPINRF